MQNNKSNLKICDGPISHENISFDKDVLDIILSKSFTDQSQHCVPLNNTQYYQLTPADR